jgi:hypothetical protein
VLSLFDRFVHVPEVGIPPVYRVEHAGAVGPVEGFDGFFIKFFDGPLVGA